MNERFKASRTMQKVTESNVIVKRPDNKPKLDLITASTGERQLAREVRKIQIRLAEQQEEEERKQRETRYGWDKYKQSPAPRAYSVIINSQNYGISYENRLTEWEKNSIKPLFVKYDKGEI